MNPFSYTSSYDSTLAGIVERLGKHPIDPRALKELLAHLPNVDLEADLAAIKLVLKQIFRYTCPQVKQAANCILYRIIRRLGSADGLRDLECEWLYHNFDADDEYALKIRARFFSVKEVEQEFYTRISWDNPVRALTCFVYLIENSTAEYAFNVTELECDSSYIFDQLYKILTIISPRMEHAAGRPCYGSVSEAMKALSLDSKGAFPRLYWGIFSRIVKVDSSLFIAKKYKILLNFYGYADSSVYKESMYFTDENYKHLLSIATPAMPTDDNLLFGGRLEYDRLHAHSITQLELLLGRVKDREKFLLANIDRHMNLFELCAKFGFSSRLIVQNKDALMPLINESIMMAYRKHKSGVDVRDYVNEEILDVVCGVHKIIVARLMGAKLSPTGFTKSEIESAFDCSVRVFPLEYLTATEFDCSCVPLLEAYQCDVEKLLPLYKQTALEDIVFYFKEIGPLKRLILRLNDHECIRRYSKVKQQIERKLAEGQPDISEDASENLKLIWHVFFYKLRGGAGEPAVPPGSSLHTLWIIDYSLVFEHLFSLEFIKFLAKENRNREGLLLQTIEYLRKAPICNTVYYTGYNFDDQKQFYYNITMPAEDIAIKTLCGVYESIEKNTEETILFHLLEIVLWRQVEIGDSDKIMEYIKEHSQGDKRPKILATNRDSWPKLFDLKSNYFIFERFLRQLFTQPAVITPALLSSGDIKAVDVLLRSGALGWKHLAGINPTFLSPEGLKVCVDLLMNKMDAHNAEFREYVERMFGTSESIDFVRLMGADDCLMIGYLVTERLNIYGCMIDAIATSLSGSLVNNYSLAKLDSKSDDAIVFELMIAPLLQARRLFWMFLVRSLHCTNNLYISLFIEDSIIKYFAEGKFGQCDGQGLLAGICCPREYLERCGREELEYFAFVLPTLYRNLRYEGKINIERFVRGAAGKKVENSKITFSKTPEFYQLRMAYYFDSVPYTATMKIPTSYPLSYPRLEFDYEKSKCPKFYLKINELLKRSSKFVEIFMQWKVNLDNRFAGHRECLICYYVLEPKMRTFADFACTNCRNKFHRKCIYEWIRTSRNTQCPLCRVEMKIW